MSRLKRNNHGIPMKRKAQSITKRYAAGESLESLAKEYEITVGTAKTYMGKFQRGEL